MTSVPKMACFNLTNFFFFFYTEQKIDPRMSFYVKHKTGVN